MILNVMRIIYIKDILIKIENVFKNYGFVKDLHEMDIYKT
jgi:hypothetical protein